MIVWKSIYILLVSSDIYIENWVASIENLMYYKSLRRNLSKREMIFFFNYARKVNNNKAAASNKSPKAHTLFESAESGDIVH